MQIVGRALLELRDQMKVEVPGGLRLGVHQQSSTADLVRDRGDPCDDVGQQTSAEPVVLVVEVDSEARKQGNGLWVGTGTLAQRARGSAIVSCAMHQA